MATGDDTVAPLAGWQIETPGRGLPIRRGALGRYLDRYCAIALTAVSHFCPAVFAATKAKRWLPAVTLTAVLSSVLVVSEYFFTPSIHSSMSAKVPVTLAAASACTVVPTVPLFAGEQTVTPGEVGALQPVPPLVTVIDTDFVAVV